MTKAVVVLSMLVASFGGCQNSQSQKVGKLSEGQVTKGAAAERTEMPSAPRYPTGSEEGQVPGPQVRLVPEDMVSQVGQTPLQVLVDNFGRPVGEKVLANVAAAVRLMTWPERGEVAVKVIVTDTKERREDGFQVVLPAVITVAPVAPLESRWYALTVAPLPDGLTMAKTAVFTNYSGAGIASRFATGSDPRIARVRRCGSGSAGGKIIIDFSERVKTSPLNIVSARADLPCNVFVPGPESGTSESITALCDSLDRGKAVEIMLGPLTSQSGVSVRDTGLLRVEPSSFVPWGDCEVASVASL